MASQGTPFDPGGVFEGLSQPLLTCEIPPPAGTGQQAFLELAADIADLGIQVVFVPDAPQGIPRASSVVAAAQLERVSRLRCIPHINTRDRNRLAVQGLVQAAALSGLRGIKAVTGDPIEPSSGRGVYEIDSTNVVDMTQEWNRSAEPVGDGVLTAVVGHTLGEDCAGAAEERLRRKVAAGARVVVTTPCLDPEVVCRFLDRVRDLQIQILVGLTLVPALQILRYLIAEVPSFRVPAPVRESMEGADSPEAIERAGLDAVLDVVRAVRDRAAGFLLVPLFGKLETLPSLVEGLREG